MPRLSLFGLTSCENADFQFDPEDDEQSGDTGGLVSEASNDLGSLRFDALLGGRATSRTIVSWYRNTELLAVDATFEASSRRSNAPDDATAAGSTNVVFDRDLSVRDLSVRQELVFSLSAAHTLDTGVELHRLASAARRRARASAMGCEMGRIRPTSVFERAGESRTTLPALSISSQVRPRISCLRQPE